MTQTTMIAAYTPPTPENGYVPFINVSRLQDDTYRVMVRSAGSDSPSYIDLDRHEMAAILTKMLFEMDDKLFDLIDAAVLKRVAGSHG